MLVLLCKFVREMAIILISSPEFNEELYIHSGYTICVETNVGEIGLCLSRKNYSKQETKRNPATRNASSFILETDKMILFPGFHH